MRLSQLLERVPVRSGYTDIDIRGIRTDSRQEMQGCLYVCIPGHRFDGHQFAAAAVEQGAAAVIAERDTGAPNQVLVPDAHEAYARICAAWFGYPAAGMQLVGVTGTNGKTSVATLVQRILTGAGVRAGLISTIRAEFAGRSIPLERTTPDAYELQQLFRQMADAGVTAAAMEVSSHALDQKRVCGLRFDAAIFTNLTQDHLDYHKTMVHYYEAKKKLFSMADYAVVNADDAHGQMLLEGLSIPHASCSLTDPHADYFADEIECSATGVQFRLTHGELSGRLRFGIPGRYSVMNALEAAACCLRLGVSWETVTRGLRESGVIPGRNEIIRTGRGFTVIIDYAHTPDGLENILKSTREYAKGRILLLFGCGGDRDREKRPLMGRIAARYADLLVVTSDNPRTEAPGAIVGEILKGVPAGTDCIAILERRDAIRYAVTAAKPGDVVILAGKGHEQYQTFGETKLWFDERRLVEGILRRMDDGSTAFQNTIL